MSRRPPYRETSEYEMTMVLELEVTFTRSRGCPAYFEPMLGQWLPGDAPDVDIHSVTHPDFFDKDGKPLDLTPYVDVERIREELLQEEYA